MRKQLLILGMMWMIVLSVSASSGKQLFNEGWRFWLGDTLIAKNETFDDSSWKKLVLPHDWSIEQKFDKDAPAGNDGGYLPTGIGWYRKTFNVPKEAKGKKLQLYFEGVYMNSDVYVNGQRAGGHPYGYSSFFVDITPYVKTGKNTVAVRVDNSKQKNCRWYTGSGIYRNVWWIEKNPVHVADWGIQIQTPDLQTAIVKTEVVNESAERKTVEVTMEIAGQVKKSTYDLQPQAHITAEQRFQVPDAKAWSPESPNLYTAQVTVTEQGKAQDCVNETFGFRTIAYSAEKGLLLNGKSILLNGGCLHHDNGILGTAAYDRAEFRKAELMKQAGFNAVRTSHNVPSEAFLHACDQVGLLVIDEAFDGWREEKNTYDYHTLFDEWWERDLKAMILRDRNHPSIFCWSIGNEVIERKKIEAVTTARKLAALCRQLDPTRPVTSALAAWDSDWEIYDPLAEAHDIVGYNYMIHKAESDHLRAPSRVMMQTESFPNDAWKNFRTVKDHSYVIGDFVWTAIDYIGESGIGRWYYDGDLPGEHYHRPLYPWHASYCGDIDLTGLRKPISHYRSMLWNENGEEHLYIAVKEPDGYKGKIRTTSWSTWPTFECWNWPGHEGKPIEVEVYSHYPTVRLYLDNQLIAEKSVNEMKAIFSLPYKAGVLKAEGLRDGKVMETTTLSTAGAPVSLRLTADREVLHADGQDLSFLVIEAIDEAGHVVPVTDNLLSVSVQGAGTLQALGNADIKDVDPTFDQTHHMWKGRALAVIRSNGKKGRAVVQVKAKGMNKGAEVVKTLRLQFK